jgi:hypothetical protein
MQLESCSTAARAMEMDSVEGTELRIAYMEKWDDSKGDYTPCLQRKSKINPELVEGAFRRFLLSLIMPCFVHPSLKTPCCPCVSLRKRGGGIL